jgi:hypothetical protein
MIFLLLDLNALFFQWFHYLSNSKYPVLLVCGLGSIVILKQSSMWIFPEEFLLMFTRSLVDMRLICAVNFTQPIFGLLLYQDIYDLEITGIEASP